MDIKFFFVSLAITLILDFMWIQGIMKKFYTKELSSIARMEKNKLKAKLVPGLIVYLIIALGITLFVSPLSKTIPTSLIYGGLFGLVVYGVYDLTNLSILKNYSMKLTIIDVIWGIILCGLVSFLTLIIL
jgi:uncharacterized membrane protein